MWETMTDRTPLDKISFHEGDGYICAPAHHI